MSTYEQVVDPELPKVHYTVEGVAYDPSEGVYPGDNYDVAKVFWNSVVSVIFVPFELFNPRTNPRRNTRFFSFGF